MSGYNPAMSWWRRIWTNWRQHRLQKNLERQRRIEENIAALCRIIVRVGTVAVEEYQKVNDRDLIAASDVPKGDPMPISPASVTTNSGLASTTATFYGAKKPKPKKKKVAKKK